MSKHLGITKGWSAWPEFGPKTQNLQKVGGWLSTINKQDQIQMELTDWSFLLLIKLDEICSLRRPLVE